MRRLQHSLKIAVGWEDAEMIHRYFPTGSRARYLVSSLDGSFSVSLAALTIPVMAWTKYIHPPLVAPINISSKVSFVFASEGKAAEYGKAIPLLPVAKVNSWKRNREGDDAEWDGR